MKPTVSCIVAVYNGERFLDEALASILAQSHPPYELIVVDDGSTDGTRGVVEALTARVPSSGATQIRYLWQENQGPSTARNTGVDAAKGDFIAFLDADDLWEPEKTTRQLARFAARPELGVSVTQVQNFWMDEVRDEEMRLAGHVRSQPIAGYYAGAFLARRAVFNQVGPFEETLEHASLVEWFLRAEACGVVVEMVPEVLVWRRLHLANRSRLFADRSRIEHLKVVHRARRKQRATPALA